MENIFLAALLLSLVALPLGIIRPKIFGGGRIRAASICTTAAVACFLGFGLSMPSDGAIPAPAQPDQPPATGTTAVALPPPTPAAPLKFATETQGAPLVAPPPAKFVTAAADPKKEKPSVPPPMSALASAAWEIPMRSVQGRFNAAAKASRIELRFVEGACKEDDIGTCDFRIGSHIFGQITTRRDKNRLHGLMLTTDGSEAGATEMLRMLAVLTDMFEPKSDKAERSSVFRALFPGKGELVPATVRLGDTKFSIAPIPGSGFLFIAIPAATVE